MTLEDQALMIKMIKMCGQPLVNDGVLTHRFDQQENWLGFKNVSGQSKWNRWFFVQE